MTQGFSFPASALHGSLYSSNKLWFCSKTSSRQEQLHAYYDRSKICFQITLMKIFRIVTKYQLGLLKKRTGWAVIKVEIAAEHIKYHLLVRLLVGDLKIPDPPGDHVQLITANFPLTCGQHRECCQNPDTSFINFLRIWAYVIEANMIL